MTPRRAMVRREVRRRGRDPLLWTTVVQLVKTVVAAVLAWWLATRVFALPQSFLAPWAALLVVHATVYRTFAVGVRQVSATALGVVLAWAVGTTLGLSAFSLTLVLLAGLLVGTVRWFDADTTGVAATALIVLTTGFSTDGLLVSRLLDTAIGIVVGLLVNLVVWPPLRRYAAIAAMDAIDDRIGAVLTDMAEGLGQRRAAECVDTWIDATRDIDAEIDRAWSLVRQASESARMNPRRSARPLREPRDWHRLLRRMEQANAEVRSMARTLDHSVAGVHEWDPVFRDGFLALLGAAGTAITQADPEGTRRVRARLDDLVDRAGGTSSWLWPEYGALVINLRNIVAAMGDVAAANPLVTTGSVRGRRRTGVSGG